MREASPSSEFTIKLFNIGGFSDLGKLANTLLTLAYFVAGLAFFIYLLIGGIQWITSGGDPKALDAARGRITNAIIGLIIVVAAYAIALILENVLGIKIVTGVKFKE